MYANTMLIIPPNDMSCCWRERAQGIKVKKEIEIKKKESKYQSCLMQKTCVCSDINTVNSVTAFFCDSIFSCFGL